MRGQDLNQSRMFSYLSPDERVPLDHPLRRIWAMSQRVLEKLSPRFDKLYSDLGRQSIPPERLLFDRVVGNFVEFAIRAEAYNFTNSPTWNSPNT